MPLTTDQIFGIACGLAAALCQSLSYLATRHFVQRRPAGASRMLLVLSHVWMGALAVVVIPFIWPWGKDINWRPVLWPLAGTAVCYLLGQLGLMMALKKTEPSRVGPLLGLKIVVLAVMSVTLVAPNSAAQMHGSLNLLQWAGVILSVIAAVALNYSGSRLPLSSTVAVAFACVAYSASDWHITWMVVTIRDVTKDSYPLAGTLGTCMCYIVCGGLAMLFLPIAGSTQWRDWRGAIPFGLTWFIAMLFLYASFGLLDVLFGNILQSTRGLMSVALGSLLIWRGLLHLEPAAGKGVFIKRILSAALMFVAVMLYMIGKAKGSI